VNDPSLLLPSCVAECRYEFFMSHDQVLPPSVVRIKVMRENLARRVLTWRLMLMFLVLLQFLIWWLFHMLNWVPCLLCIWLEPPQEVSYQFFTGFRILLHGPHTAATYNQQEASCWGLLLMLCQLKTVSWRFGVSVFYLGLTLYPKGYPDGVVTSPSLSQSRPKVSPQDGMLPRSKILFQGCHIHFLQTSFQSRSNAESVQCLNSFIYISLVCLQDHAHVINSKFLESYLKSETIEFKCEVFGSLLSFLRLILDLKTWQMGDLIGLSLPGAQTCLVTACLAESGRRPFSHYIKVNVPPIWQVFRYS
jgi:hypothetical protein